MTVVCTDCGAPGTSFRIWFTDFGLVCGPCRDKQIKRAISAYQAEEHDVGHHKYNVTPICPHCGHKNGTYDISGPDEEEIECPRCDREYLIIPDFDVTFSTEIRGAENEE